MEAVVQAKTRTSTRRKTVWLMIAAVLCATCVMYFYNFGDAPIYLGGDEARIATHAYSIATTGTDLNGRRMPLFVNMTDSPDSKEGSTRWYQPVLFYLEALVLKFLPLSESSIRIPTAVIGILDVFLMYLLARRLFPDTLYPALAAVTLAVSPAHFIFSRQALDYICPLPFVLGWLLCLAAFLETGSARLSLLAGLLLGVGFYSYIAAWAMMPVYLLLTWMAQLQSRRASPQSLIAAGVGFALPLLILVPWLWWHPDMLRDTIGRYQLYDVRHLSPLQGVKDFLNYNNVPESISVYWDYFNPAYLFLAGGSNLTTGTRRAGVFLWPLSVFLVAGISDLWKRRRSPISIVLLAGLALAPLPATLVDERYAIQRELFVLPFGVLISVFGATLLLRQRAFVRLAAVLLLLAMPIQYAYFAHDYFTDYRIRSAFWFDPVNFRDVAEYLIASDSSGGVPAVYLSRDLDDGAPRWEFYLAKHGREDLRRRTQYFTADTLDMSKVPAGSLLVLYANDPKLATLLGAEKCSVTKTVIHAGGSRSAVILRKNV